MMKNPHTQQVELNIGNISSTEPQLNICNKKFVIMYLLITKFTKIICYENLALYSMYGTKSFKIHNYMYVCMYNNRTFKLSYVHSYIYLHMYVDRISRYVYVFYLHVRSNVSILCMLLKYL